MTNDEYKRIEQLLKKDKDDLYIELGKEILSDRRQAFPLPPKRYIQEAKQWLIEHKKQLQIQICNHERVKQLMTNNGLKNRVLLVSAIIDLISSILTGVSPVTVAVLLVKEGIDTLCKK